VNSKMIMKFKGAKVVHNLEGKVNDGEGDYKVFWERLFGDYLQPLCPICKKVLVLEKVNVERPVSFPFAHGGSLVMGDSRIDLLFSCPDCNAEVFAIGDKITFEDRSFTIENLYITEIRMGVR